MTPLDPHILETQRPRLRAIASRILGSSADADDVVQEVWLRAAATGTIDDPAAFLTTVTTRLCLDQLRRRGTRQGMEDRVRDATRDAGSDEAATPGPEDDLLVADQVSDAMEVLLNTLRPAERAAFVLHDIFGYGFAEVGAILGRSDTAARQLASRARRAVRAVGAETEPPPTPDTAPVVAAFLSAAQGGDLATLMTLLAPDAVMHVDRIGQEMGAEPSYSGAEAVANRFQGARAARLATVDGAPAVAWFAGETVRVAFIFWTEADRVAEIELIADPEVLATLEIARA